LCLPTARVDAQAAGTADGQAFPRCQVWVSPKQWKLSHIFFAPGLAGVSRCGIAHGVSRTACPMAMDVSWNTLGPVNLHCSATFLGGCVFHAQWRPCSVTVMRSWLLHPDPTASCLTLSQGPCCFTPGEGCYGTILPTRRRRAGGAWVCCVHCAEFLQVLLWQSVGLCPASRAYAGRGLISGSIRFAGLRWLGGRLRRTLLRGSANPICRSPPSAGAGWSFRDPRSLLLGWIRELGGDRLPALGYSRPLHGPVHCTSKITL